MKSNRRNFLKSGGAALASAALLGTIPVHALASGGVARKLRFGFQTWTIREQLVTDFTGTLEKMAGMGYSEVEMCSPLGYSDAGFEPLNQMSGKEMRKIIKGAGLQMGFHNHHMEFEKRGDELIYDALLDQLDPDLVKMQFQVAVVNVGYKAADYFRKYPGRFISAHLADWSAEKEAQVPIGQGEVDWVDFFEAAETGGVKNFFVEMDPDTFGPSAEYLLSL